MFVDTIYFNLTNKGGPLSTFATYKFPFSQFSVLWKSWFQSDFAFFLKFGVARSLYRLE